MFDERAHAAVAVLAVARHAAAEPDRLGPGALDELLVQQHVELAAMHGILRPVIAGDETARFRIDVVAVQAHQRPFLGGHADAVEVLFGEAEIVKFAHGIGLQIDADAERAHLARRFEHNAGHADPFERERRRQPADAAAGNEHEIVRHSHSFAPQPVGFH